ncbi:hypothetical protein ABWH89_20270 [Hoeflea alexandrii]|uniref:hypothetical protein n=1 Tax=Hoeflea alexandrii TaxID=288436 RepID=UPI0035D13158
MIDWDALTETDLELKRWGRQAQTTLAEAHELELTELASVGASRKLGSDAKAFIRDLPGPEEIRSGRFLLRTARAEKATPTFIAQCLINRVFNRSRYDMALSRQAFLDDILSLLEEADPVSCLAVFRAMRHIGLNEKFVPPAGLIAGKILTEESQLNSQTRDLVRLEKLVESCAHHRS